MSRVRAVLLAVTLFAGCARERSSPRASLERLGDGVRAQDRAAIERYLDVPRTAESAVDEVRAAALAAGDTSGTDAVTRSMLVVALEQSIWTTLLDPAEAGRFHGITDVQERGDIALAGVRIRLNDGDSAALVHLRMERDDGGGHWRVVGVEGLARVIPPQSHRR